MNGRHPIKNKTNNAANQAAPLSPEEAAQDPMLQAVLQDFRASIHAWSDATYHTKSLVLSEGPRRTLWNQSLAWSLSLVLAIGVASTGAYEYHHRELARQAAAQREVEHQRQLALEEHAREVDELLAKVDSDVSQEVPNAMEPLASLMAEDESQ